MKKFLTVTLLLVLTFSLLAVTAFAGEGADAQTTEANVFSEVYEVILRHSDKILSALAFLASLFLAFAYRSGIIPLIKGGLNTLGTAVGKLKEETDKASEISLKTISEAKDKLADTENVLTALTDKLGALEEKLGAAIEDKERAKDMKLILEAQIDMLYEIFMSSSIPLFQKEAVGEKIAAMKRRLLGTEADTDE